LGGAVEEAFANEVPFTRVGPTDLRHPYWTDVPSQAALNFRGAASFLDTDRGRRLKEHILCRR
jgi:hypothetical protein